MLEYSIFTISQNFRYCRFCSISIFKQIHTQIFNISKFRILCEFAISTIQGHSVLAIVCSYVKQLVIIISYLASYFDQIV